MRKFVALSAAVALASTLAAGCTDAQFNSTSASIANVRTTGKAAEATALPIAAAAATNLAVVELMSALSSEKNAGQVIAAGAGNVIAAGGMNLRVLNLGASESNVDYKTKTGTLKTVISGKEWVNANFKFDYSYDQATGKMHYDLTELKGDAGGFTINLSGTFDATPKEAPKPLPAHAMASLSGTMTYKDEEMKLETFSFDVDAPFTGTAADIGQLRFVSNGYRFICSLGLADNLPTFEAKYGDADKPDSEAKPVPFDAASFFGTKK